MGSGRFSIQLALWFALAALYHAAAAETVTGRVVRVADGDTITVLDSNNIQHRIRLQGIDAPERKQPYGNKSRENLSHYIAGRFVVVEYAKRDRYGRIVGKVLLSDQDICLQQASDGMAWHYKRYQREQSPADRKLYSQAETEARNERRGLWRDPHPVPPWAWRRRAR